MFVLAEIPEQVIFVVVMLAITAFKAISEKLQKKRESSTNHEEEEKPAYDYVGEYEEYERQLEEQQREILARQQGRVEQAPPPLPAAPLVVEKAEPVEVYTPPVVEKPKLSLAEKKALENLKKSNTQAKTTRAGSTARARARRVLASPYAARDAIVLSEILGPPKGQRM